MASFNSKSIFKFASSSDIVKIITACSLFFVCLQFTRLTFVINGESDAPFYTVLYNKFALPMQAKQLIKQPWSLLTYLFSELNFMRLVGDMIWLWIFATVIEDLKGSNRIIPIFFTGGILGAVLMLAFSAWKPDQGLPYYAGSLASLTAIATAALMYKPKYRFSMFFGIEIPIWVFVLIFFTLQVLTINEHRLPLVILALGGALAGLGYTSYCSAWYEQCTKFLQKAGAYWGNNDHFILEKEKEKRSNALRHTPFKKVVKYEMGIDDILDKINDTGIDSLSKEEKKRLEDFSKST